MELIENTFNTCLTVVFNQKALSKQASLELIYIFNEYNCICTYLLFFICSLRLTSTCCEDVKPKWKSSFVGTNLADSKKKMTNLNDPLFEL